MAMKVRIGAGSIRTASAGPRPGSELGSRPGHEPGGGTGAALAELVDELEARRIDSVWLSDLASSPGTVDPLVGLAYAAGRTRRLKLGTGVLVLPGRNPALVAAQLAGLAAVAPGRVLPSFGVRAALPADRSLFPVPPGRRGDVFEEALTVVRALLTEPVVTHRGEFFQLRDASVGPLPGTPLDLWLGGRLPIGLDRVGRLGDGWLGAYVTPEEAAGCRARIETAAAEAGREVEDDHYGMNLTVALDGTAERDLDAMRTAAGRQRTDLPDVRPLIQHGWAALRAEIGRFVDVGVTKFVVRPAGPVPSMSDFLDQFVTEMGPLQN